VHGHSTVPPLPCLPLHPHAAGTRRGWRPMAAAWWYTAGRAARRKRTPTWATRGCSRGPTGGRCCRRA